MSALATAGLVIPVYNHRPELERLLLELRPHGLPCILVDDGGDDPSALDRLAAREASWVTLLRHPENRGKGAAVLTGAQEALRRGWTHLLQIDADGQHASSDVPRFLETARAQPGAVVSGAPVFDDSAPRARRWGRLATNVWIWINTLSYEIKDGLCGFRVYPLEPLLALAARVKLGRRMDFDPEVLVRLHWQGLRIVSVPTRVRYPREGRSHFKMGRDNWLISRMHARLFFEMLGRVPGLLVKGSRHNKMMNLKDQP